MHTELALLVTHLRAALLAEQQQQLKRQETSIHNTNISNTNVQNEVIDWHLSQMASEYEADIGAALGDDHDGDQGGGEYKGVFLRVMRSGIDVYSDKESELIYRMM